jgi:hypothetical protein
MSITFSTEISRQVEEACYCVDGNPDPDCRWCKGTGVEVRDEPLASVNFSNTNVGMIFQALELPSEEWGQWTLAQIPGIRRKIVLAMQKRAALEDLVYSDFEEMTRGRVEVSDNTWMKAGPSKLGGTGARLVLFENTADDLVNRLIRLNSVLADAQENSCGVTWS